MFDTSLSLQLDSAPIDPQIAHRIRDIHRSLQALFDLAHEPLLLLVEVVVFGNSFCKYLTHYHSHKRVGP